MRKQLSARFAQGLQRTLSGSRAGMGETKDDPDAARGAADSWPNTPMLEEECGKLVQAEAALEQLRASLTQKREGRRAAGAGATLQRKLQAEEDELRAKVAAAVAAQAELQTRVAELYRDRDEWAVAKPEAPAAPEITSVEADGGVTVVEFSEPPQDGGAPVTWYRLSSTDGSYSAAGAQSPLVLEGVLNGYPQQFHVQAANISGPGPWSPPTPPVTPGAITAASPGEGPVAGGTQVLIVGSALCAGEGDVVRVTLDGTIAQVVTQSESAIEVTTGASEPSAQAGDVVVHSRDLGERVLEGAFTYHAPGSIMVVQRPPGDSNSICVLGTDMGDGTDITRVVVNGDEVSVVGQSASHVIVFAPQFAGYGAMGRRLDVRVCSVSRGECSSTEEPKHFRFGPQEFYRPFAAPWTPDEASGTCTHPTCQSVFNLCSRRHHCRRCGHVYCGDCTKARMRLHTAPTSIDGPAGASAGDRAPLERVCVHCAALEEAMQGKQLPPPGEAALGKGLELEDAIEGEGTPKEPATHARPLSRRVRLLEGILDSSRPAARRYSSSSSNPMPGMPRDAPRPLRGPGRRGNTLWVSPGIVADAQQLRRHWVLPAGAVGTPGAASQVLTLDELEDAVVAQLDAGAPSVLFTVQHEAARLRVDGVARLAHDFDPAVRARFGIAYVSSVFDGGFLELLFRPSTSAGGLGMPSVTLRATGGQQPSSASFATWGDLYAAVHGWMESVDELQNVAVVRYGAKHFVTQQNAQSVDADTLSWAAAAGEQLRPVLERGSPMGEDAVARLEESCRDMRKVLSAVEVGAHGRELRREAGARELALLMEHAVVALSELIAAFSALVDVSPQAASEPLQCLQTELERWADALTTQQEAIQMRRTSRLFAAHIETLADAVLRNLALAREHVLASRAEVVRRALPRLAPAAALLSDPPTFLFMMLPLEGQQLGPAPAKILPLCSYGLHGARCFLTSTSVTVANAQEFIATCAVPVRLSAMVVLGALAHGSPLPFPVTMEIGEDLVEAQATAAEAMLEAANAALEPATRGILSDLEELRDDDEAWAAAKAAVAKRAEAAHALLTKECPVTDLAALHGAGGSTAFWVCPLHLNEWLSASPVLPN